MGKLVLFMSAATAALVGASAYLALQLSAARDELAVAHLRPREPPASTPMPKAAAASSTAIGASQPAAAPLQSSDQTQHGTALLIYSPEQRNRSSEFLEKYRSRAGHEELLNDRR